MKSCGVIVEYNPFHNGHQYHLEMAHEASQADVVVAVMSGNFLQRGEPAILDKWTRAKEAIENGADLVIELPVASAVQSADYFAKGAVRVLHELGVSSLCFGTDSEEELDYDQFARFNEENQNEINETFQSLNHLGLSYPQQMNEVYRLLLPDWPVSNQSPNHILGMSYAKENQKYAKPMSLFPIKRQVSNYHDKELNGTKFASATAIREAVLADKFEDLADVIPVETLNDLKGNDPIDWEKAWPFLKYQLMVNSEEELRSIYQMVEGIEYRLKEMVLKANSFEEFVTLVKTKRFTWTRIQRLCVYVLLQLTEAEVTQSWEQPYLRILGFNKVGQVFMKQQRKMVSSPVISNLKKEHQKIAELDIRAGLVYELITGKNNKQDFYRIPHIKK
ncbi:nucleotidyltransferase [Vagococcus fessus]|uniref:tRNA(Met) cytidine acetate ligase n=1 Tax=Vagococcus fessus TaxID=120370 RepID=A0A430ADF7_9ENTE|nr:hypothetical protein CBF31_00175 [Vagococcus fessus]